MSLLAMLRPDTSSHALRLRHGARIRTFGQVVRLRLAIAPLLATLALTFAAVEDETWRRSVLITVVVVLCTLSVVEYARLRRGGVTGAMVIFNAAAMLLGQLALVVATGGLFSPVVPAMVLAAGFGGLVVGRRSVLIAVFAVQIPTLWVLAAIHLHPAWPSLIPELLGGRPHLESSWAPIVFATCYSMMLIVVNQVGMRVRAVYEDLMAEAMAERDRSLDLLAEQGRALTTLSGEIAHELKNPLASVKGLAALVSRSAEGQTAERLGVLRREVDRMQATLEEFLNFSRPLVPLVQEELDLAELTTDVAALHEATARERRVRLVVHGDGPIALHGDRRKVRQILINLVQNALDASPPNRDVTLRLAADAERAWLRVEDEGSGLDPALAERVFDAGVTTKERGSGLGLPMARSLARQHGGELDLEARDEGGARAVLSLPLVPEAT